MKGLILDILCGSLLILLRFNANVANVANANRYF